MLAKASFTLSLLLGFVQAVPAPWGGRQSGRQSGQYDMQLDWSDPGFLSSVSFGNPKREFTVFVDWTWVSLLVMTPRCNGTYNPDACLYPGQTTWDPRNSSTFKNLSSKYPDFTWKPNHFFFQNPMHVTIGSDSLQVGSVTENTVVQLTDLTFDAETLGFAFPFTGIFGLSPVFKGNDLDYQSPFYQQWQQGGWKNGVAGFVYCYDESKKAVCNGHDGIQTVGGVRNDLIKNNQIWWYNVKKEPDVDELDFVYDPPVYNYWGIELEGLSIGNETQKIEPTSQGSGKAAIFDHASYGRGTALTPNAYKRLVGLTHGTPVKPKSPPNNGPQEFFSVDCSKAASFPDIKYTFVGQQKEWVVTAEHYVAQLEDGSCVLNVRALATDDRFIGNFGETFAKDKYVILDFENLRVGISDLQWQ